MEETEFQKYKKYIEPRVDFLKENKRYLEAFIFQCFILEKELRGLIKLFYKFFEIYTKIIDLGINNLKFTKNIENKSTLGSLVKELKNYLKDKKLIDNLEKITKLRNKITHNLFENNINELEKEIEKIDFYQNIISIMKYELEVTKNIIQIIPKKIENTKNSNNSTN